MAEYGSGIFYGRCNSNQNLSSFSQLGLLSLPSELDLGPPISKTSKTSHEGPKDMILLAEFSEIEGPIPLLSIPLINDIDINLNDFVLQLMSTDYQNMGNSGFQIFKDTCLLQEDPEKGHYTYVHYFTLYDVTARGFVRPMCLAYFSKEPEKLRKCFKNIQEDFNKVTEYLRVCNLNYFFKEVKNRIVDLHYTKERYIYSQERPTNETDNHSSPKVEKMDEEKLFGTSNRKRAFSFNQSMPPGYAHFMFNNNKANDESYSLDKLNDFCNGKCVGSNETLSPSSRLLRFSSPPFRNNFLSSSLPLNTTHSSMFSPITISSRKDTLKLSSHFKSPFRSHLPAYQKNNGKDFPKEEILSYSSDSSCSTIKSSRGATVPPVERNQNTSFTQGNSHGNQPTDVEEASVLQHTNLDALAIQLLDCQCILEVINDYLRHSETIRELDKLLEEIKSKSQSPLYKAMEELELMKSPTAGPEPKEPSLFVISLLRRNYRNMRTVRSLCGIGYIAGISKLLEVYRRFSKPTLTLLFENMDKELYENPFSTLFMGSIPVINMGIELESPVTVPPTSKFSLSESCWNEDLVRLLHVDLSKPDTPEPERLEARENGGQSHVTVADDCLEVFTKSNQKSRRDESNGVGLEGELKSPLETMPVTITDGPSLSRMGSTSSDISWASSTPRDFASFEGSDQEVEEEGEEELVCDVLDKMSIKMAQHDIDMRLEAARMYHMTALIHQFSGVYQCIIHSILSGKPIIVASPEHLKSVVMLYTKTLSTILCVKPNEFLPVLKWHTGTITSHHLKMYKIIGTCIPERLHVQDLMSNATLNQVTVLNIETGHISGVAYSGTLLRKTDQLTRRYFRSDLSLQAALQSILVAVGMKVFMHFHLRRTTLRTSNEILRGIGVHRGDWLMIEHLSRLMEEQISQCHETNS